MRVGIYQGEEFPCISRNRPGEGPESCTLPEDYDGAVVEIPESIVTFYLHAMNQMDMAVRLLQPYADKATWPGEPGDPRSGEN